MKATYASALVALLAAMAVFAWLRPTDSYPWNLPDGLPQPFVPEDNPMSGLKIELGRHLFYDRRLSVNETTSCATCHIQALAFTDGKARALGATGELHPRGAMSLVNVAYASRLTWANQLLERLEFQALVPIFGEEPVEMGMSGREGDIVAMLKRDTYYAKSIARAFPNDADPYSVLNVVRAIAAFVRSIVSFESDYDRYLRGDADALSDSALRGMELFFSETTECFHCHGGFNFTDSSTHTSAAVESIGFHNNGLYNTDGNGAYPADNRGLLELTGNRRDMGRFKAPTLRNIALTAPYMHDGSIENLDGVLDHYLAGGRTITDGPNAGDGSRNPYKSVFVRPFELTNEQRADLLAFLHALTDQRVIADPALSDPFSPPER